MIFDSATPLGSVVGEMRLSAGNLPLVGLPAVTTKVCPLQGQMVCMTRLSGVDTPACNMSSLRDLKTSVGGKNICGRKKDREAIKKTP